MLYAATLRYDLCFYYVLCFMLYASIMLYASTIMLYASSSYHVINMLYAANIANTRETLLLEHLFTVLHGSLPIKFRDSWFPMQPIWVRRVVQVTM